MPNAFVRLLLFLSSYAPLLVIFAVQAKTTALTLGFTAVSILSVGALFAVLRTTRNFAASRTAVVDSSSKEAEAMSYIVTYLIPFLELDFTNARKAAALALFFIVLAVLYVNSNMIYINPVLSLAGYHVFEIVDDTGKRSILLTNQRSYVARGATLGVASLSNTIVVEK